jgi:hypothetical protein
MIEYKPLLVKFNACVTLKRPKKIDVAYYSGLCDVQIVVGLACILPMLRVVNILMKAAESNDMFVCDYLIVVGTSKTNLAKSYINEKTQFTQELF